MMYLFLFAYQFLLQILDFLKKILGILIVISMIIVLILNELGDIVVIVL